MAIIEVIWMSTESPAQKNLINTTLSSCILFKKITNKRKKTKKGGGAMKGMIQDHQNQGFCNKDPLKPLPVPFKMPH